jgi:pimeloyl-ACP methyl ester carboxylesterase
MKRISHTARWRRTTGSSISLSFSWAAAGIAICEIKRSRLAEPMRANCADLTEAIIDGGHWLMLERADAVNAAIDGWLSARRLIAQNL